ncbi:MAG TPA: pyridoxamine 5'-phosphate oxidase [Steroidobacteraceae bacterium]|jgi:pyridoxamine 5'-phosphate oxidase|nr:pyridoxamine 5'-phosphate oxidase [Steroidobacteraceae bacterium]
MSEPSTEFLGNPLPAQPLMVASEWLAEAWRRRLQPNPNAMTLATATLEGWPAARIVLCKDVVGVPGYVVFYTNFHSRKGLELAENPRAAAVMHWDHMHRQVRIEGLVEPAPAADSDAYFASRARDSRIGAWASAQSKPVASREALIAQVREATQRFASTEVPRPSFWGGYRLWAEAVELWVEGDARIHDRARWTRALKRSEDGSMQPGPWSVTRLQP